MRVLKEPLLHFLILGGLLFTAHAALAPHEEAASPAQVIRITAADADWLREMWTRQWHRPPADEELGGLLEDQVREEVLAREARDLQLDVGDTIVRRRLAQKMAFVLDDTIRSSEPPEADLRALHGTRPDLVRTSGRVSFTQVFFDRSHGDERALREAAAALASLSDAPDETTGHGDSFLLGDSFIDQEERSLADQFGAAFARTVVSAEPGRWSGPIPSSYGLHLVKVTAVERPRTYDFAEVRDRLAQEWHRNRQATAGAQLYADMRRKYRIIADPSVRPLLETPANHAKARP